MIIPVYDLCYLLVAWLVLCKGLSRNTGNTLLQAFRFILFTSLQLIYLTLKSLGAQVDAPSPITHIALDMRAIYSKLKLDPELIRIFCCPTCFKQYPANTRLSKCNYRKSAKAPYCNTPLFKSVYRKNKKGQRKPKQVPRCFYTTQSFDSWLEYLVSRPELDPYFHETFGKKGNWHPGGKMHDVYDSPAWQEYISDFLDGPYHLVFALYLDWFNPLGNKSAGRVVASSWSTYC